jgi:hypothetical protein
MHVAWAYIYTRRYADAVRESRRALALSPGYKEAYGCLEEAYLLSGNEASAREARWLHGSKGAADRSRARSVRRRGRVHARERPPPRHGVARESERAAQRRVPACRRRPELAALHGDARFVKMLESVGLEPVRPLAR